MSSRKLAKNTIASFIFQICTIMCGFITIRLILHGFGSEVNGLVSSIAQFLGIISFLELGLGVVIQASLYKPLALKDENAISQIIVSSQKFFHRLAYILLTYVVVLVFLFPIMINKNFDFAYTGTLIAAMSISLFAQYYFGITYRLLITADQRGYIFFNVQTITLILSTIVCYLLIREGASIQIVKIAISLIYLVRPFFLVWYVKRHYVINNKIKYIGEPIKQKWNGIAQHVAAVILDGTDIIVLTIFSSLSIVSIYSIYFLVVNGVKQLMLSMMSGIQALLGELWAKQDLKTLNDTFAWCEWAIHTGTTFLFGCTAILVVPFIQVYTNGINDANYIQPVFAAILTAANAGHCFRIPYNLMILSAGHFKQTQHNYIIAATLNIVISVILVTQFGLIGVAIGTLIAMLYQTIWMAIYVSKNLIMWPIKKFLKQMSVNIFTVLIMYITTSWVGLDSVTYLAWVLMAIRVSTISAIVMLLINLIFYRDKVMKLPETLKKKGQKS